jgi:two-component system, LytTR family, response regulator AlgR
MTTKILIVDDEAPARRRLLDLLDDCRADFPLTVVGEASNGVEALEQITESEVDIVILDIRMPVMDGIEAAMQIAALPDTVKRPKIIFSTAFDAHAVKAFELSAIDYLLKPYRAERLLVALKKAATLTTNQAQAIAQAAPPARRFLSIHERGKVVFVPLEDVLYLKAEQKYVTVRTAAREYLYEESLTKLEEQFPNIFTRLHRNSLVATKAIAGFERVVETGEDGQDASHWVAVVRGLDERLPVSRRQQHIIRSF